MSSSKKTSVKMCDMCQTGCTGICKKDIRGVIFLFNSKGMFCRCMEDAEVKQQQPLNLAMSEEDRDVVGWLVSACKKDMLSRDIKPKKKAEDIWRKIKQAGDWPKCAFFLDEQHKPWQAAGNFDVDREASLEECAAFIARCLRAYDEDTAENGGDPPQDVAAENVTSKIASITSTPESVLTGLGAKASKKARNRRARPNAKKHNAFQTLEK